MTVTVAVPVLFDVSGSGVCEEATAVLTSCPSTWTVAVTVIDADSPGSSVPTVQRASSIDQAPTDGVAPVSMKPAGMSSFSTTPEAADGPSFVTVTSNVAVPPSGTDGVEVVLTTRTSVFGASVTSTVEVLSPVFGSGVADVVVAVFETIPVAVVLQVPVSWTTTDPPGAMSPSSHRRFRRRSSTRSR